MTGKRKRATAVVPRATAKEDEEEKSTTPDTSYQDVFRKFFESQFEPIDLPGGGVERGRRSEEDSEEEGEEDSEESESGSDWDGMSVEDEDDQVEVVEYCDTRQKEKEILDKKARKAFMVCVLSDTRPSHHTDPSIC